MSDRGPATPPLDAVRAVLAALERAGIVAAVGGSGLLAALGLTDHLRDWDVTTDADPLLVHAALRSARVPFTQGSAGDGAYATKARLRVDGGDHDVEVIVGFAVRTGPTVVELPTRITGHWLGLPLADPAVWTDAYELIGRHDSAAALRDWLRREHGRPHAID